MGTQGDPGSIRTKRRLIEGRLMRCPRCKQQHDVLQYTPMRMIEEFATETTPIYKCPNCRWLFAPCLDEEIIRSWLTGMSASPGEEE
jgi:DNA-directed RNA polymerase subunit RPC12/RpoP